jgi:beta-galactosidase
MIRILIRVLFALSAAVAAMMTMPAAAESRLLSQDWLFSAGDTAGAQAPDFDDRGWRAVSVPHDWSIMDGPDGSAPFDPEVRAGQDSGYLPGGVGWYRRPLRLTADEAQQVVRLNFEAIYMDAEIWLNGEPVASNRYGYTAFTADLTGKVRAGDNVIAVRANHPDPSSRWYAGSGIIRPVTLEILDRVHIEPSSVFVTTPVATAERGLVAASLTVANLSARPQRAELVSAVVAATGATLAEAREVQSVPAGGRTEFAQTFDLDRPLLWSPDSPNLHTLVQQVRIGGVIVDERRTRFGIRSVTLDAENGMQINGQPVLLRGGNIHHDNYMLGAAGFPDADRRKVELMKAAGYNAIRNAHNPASRATLDAADELGMFVINEAFDAWRESKRDEDYARFFDANWQADIDSMVLSGRNHPSVVMWSIGNEIPEADKPDGIETARRLAARVRALDPSRPVTQGMHPNTKVEAVHGTVLDVIGYNYRADTFADEHEKLPQTALYTSESVSRSAFADWRAVETMPWVIGDFVWTAVDYLGESGIGWMGYSNDWQKLGPYPWHLAYCGEIDATGRKRPAAYYRQILWKTGIDPIAAFVRQPEGTEELPDRHLYPVTQPHLDWSLDDVHPSWTWAGQEGKPLEVVVYSEFPEVELFLNGESLGRKAVGLESEYKTAYAVPYAPGRLVAVGYRDGREAGRWSLQTAAAPSEARVSTNRAQVIADGDDVAYVTLELADANGTPVYDQAGDREVRVTVSGAGTLAGLGNGNPQDASSLQSGVRKSFHGRAVAAIRAGTEAGPIWVKVEAEGLPPREVRIDAVSAAAR